MATIQKENLDERIERIKKRNEEIEKKYREAEEDRLMALKDNAMVEIKPPKDEDWPKGHKYDKIDFTYDVKPEKLEELKQKTKEEAKTKRDYKKFADGEGPPPDPAYNFLADAERDGTTNTKNEKNDKKDLKQNKNNKNNDGYNKRGGSNNNSFRGRGGKAPHPKYQKQNSQPEYEQWRSEREKIDEARINRQKIGDGKWKREWDNDKINSENEALLRPERVTLGDAMNIGITKKSPVNTGKQQKVPNAGHNNPVSADCLIEKRGNITVSVSQTGEVKSVKLTSAPVIGTGRVGPRQVTKPQFSIQLEKEPQAPVPTSPRPQNKGHNKNNNVNGHHQNIHQDKSAGNQSQYRQTTPSNQTNPTKTKKKIQSPKLAPTSATNNHSSAVAAVVPGPGPINVVTPVDPLSVQAAPFTAELPITSANGVIPVVDLSHKPEFAKKSVQDRLLRARQANQTDINSTNIIENKTTDLSPFLIDNKKDEPADDLKTNCDKTNESIQTAKPIAACY